MLDVNLTFAVPGIVKTLENGVLTVRLDRVEKKNAMTLEMYRQLTKTINDAATDNSVNFFVFTGTGDFFSSGNDLGNFIEKLKTGADIQEMAVDSAKLVLDYVNAFIDFPKPMIALVNGPSIGIGCTILGLFDLVYASDKAYFQTPFSQLGLNPEGCSSYTFPQLFGGPLAAEVLLMNRKITAEEALKARFVTDVFPADQYEAECKKRVDYISKQPPKSLMYSKMLIRSAHRDALLKANIDECKRLEERFTSDEAMSAVANFFKSKGSKM